MGRRVGAIGRVISGAVPEHSRPAAFFLMVALLIGACSQTPPQSSSEPAARSSGDVATPAVLTPSPRPGASVLTVTTVTDAVNGDVSSASALRAMPGSDGMSLREAILATNATPGPHWIRFAEALNGQTIAPRDPLPPFTRDGVTLTGSLDARGEPAITINGALNPAALIFRVGPEGYGRWGLLWLLASDLVIQRLRFVELRPLSNGGGRSLVWIGGLPFDSSAQLRASSPPQPARIRNIGFYDNVFDNTGVTDHTGMTAAAGGVNLQIPPWLTDTAIEDVSVARNRFVGYRGDAVKAAPSGTNTAVRRLRVYDNTMMGTGIAMELVPSGTSNSVSDTQFVRNRVVGNVKEPPVALNPAAHPDATRNVIERTLISGNTFLNNRGVAFHVEGGVDNATDNVVRDTRFVNNVIVHDQAGRGGIMIRGGGGASVAAPAARNRVEGVEIVNNTIIREGATPASFQISSNHDGGFDNSVSGVIVRNTIFWGAGSDFQGEAPERVEHSITTARGRAGTDGNLGSDPRFVDASQRDFRLRPGSPAIDAGRSDGAPSTDIDGRARVDDPETPNRGAGAVAFIDIGAYEFGAPAGARVRIQLGGDAIGKVTSTPVGLECPVVCIADLTRHTPVTLIATPATGARFAGWRGACAGMGACVVTADSALQLIAIFEPDGP